MFCIKLNSSSTLVLQLVLKLESTRRVRAVGRSKCLLACLSIFFYQDML